MTGKELVAFCRSKIGTPYIYGAKGKVMTKDKYDDLRRIYGKKYVWDSDAKKIGRVCVDCSGLISWACNRPLNSAGWKGLANVVRPISSIADAPVGALVWCTGHIGVYTGMKNGVPYYVAADGSAYGVREAPISKNRFTHWLLVEDVFSYEEEDEEVIEKDTIIVNGEKHQVDMIRKDGYTFLKTRDIAALVGYQAGSQGRTPVLTRK